MRSAKDSMICWNPGTDQVAIVPHPDRQGLSDKYLMTGLGAYKHVKEATFEDRKTIAFIEAVHLIIRDGCEPHAVHQAMMKLEEYRDGCADDMPGIKRGERA